MPSLRSGLTIRASEPKHSERINPPSEQLLDDSMTGEQFNHETMTTQPEKGNKSLTGDTGVEQESTTELPTSSCAACVTVEAPSNSQQSESISDKPTDISAESDFLSLRETNGEAALDTDCQIDIFLDKSLVEDITPAAASTSNDTSFGDGSQVQTDADHWLLVPDFHTKSGDKSACDSASSQPQLSTGVQVTKPVESDTYEPGQAFLKMTGKDIGSAIMIMDEEAKQTTKPGVAIVIVDEDTEQTIKTDSTIVIIDKDTEQTAKTDSVIEIIDDDTEQTTKPRRYSPRNAAKRSFKDFVVNDSLWMGQISEDLDEIMELTDYILAMSEKVVKRAKIIKTQLIESRKYIRDCGGEEMKVTDRLEKL